MMMRPSEPKRIPETSPVVALVWAFVPPSSRPNPTAMTMISRLATSTQEPNRSTIVCQLTLIPAASATNSPDRDGHDVDELKDDHHGDSEGKVRVFRELRGLDRTG